MTYIGAVDPGKEPDPSSNPLAFANCSDTIFETNMMAVQFESDIYYR